MNTSICVPGYRITEEIYAGARTLIYRGIRVTDQYPVTIEILRNPFPSITELLSFRHKYEIGKDFDLPNIIKTLAFEPYQNAYALILEDCGSISLQSYLDRVGAFGSQPQLLATFLQIAIQLAEALDGLYAQRTIHKDIKPANIIINPATLQIKLIDFSISSRLPKEIQEINNVNRLEGTLAYLSPEQTGRMNRGIDYRSDYYALGVTFYKLLTGKLPFVSADPMELVHCHLAKQPVPVHHLTPLVPVAISQIVGKLMAKNAEDRYQNALGLKHDLEQCLAQWQETNKIELFSLGAQDLSDRFLIPERLYGRAAAVNQLLTAFDRVSQGRTELMLVAGSSGIGKTVVIQEVHKPIVRQRGYFIKGKYDQFQRNIPFSAFVQAFRDLMGQLLAESDAQLQTWKADILAAVGEQGQVLIDVIPELERIIGSQPPAPVLSSSAAQQRFNLLMQKFISLFTTAAHPLVLFLDDLQWADLASLNLLQLLLQDAGHLLVLGAYRDNEVSPVHPAIVAIAEIKHTGVPVNTISLAPLNQADLNQLVADTLNCNLLVAQPLAELVALKTKGNPFFATQFLKSLYEDGLIRFDRLSQHGKVGGWICDLTQVRSLAITNDVVEFMALQLQKLPPATQEAIALAACIGAQFDLQTLAIVGERSPEVTADALWSGLQENLLIPTTEIYKFFSRSGLKTSEQITANPIYRFLHDRVQQAAYSLIPVDRQQATHLKIGRLLYQNATELVRTERLFDIVGHLNVAQALITNPSDRAALAQLNLTAGIKARKSTAYAAANIYGQAGIELLAHDCWLTQYQLTLDLHLAAAEAAYLDSDLERMNKIAAVVMQSALTILDKVAIYRIQIAAFTANGQMQEAIAIGRQALAQLGIDLPLLPDQADMAQALETLAIQLQGKKIAELVSLPVMTDRQSQQTMALLADLGAPVFISLPALMPIISATMVGISLQFGHTATSALGYINHSLVLTSFFADVQTGYSFGELALALVNQDDAPEVYGVTSFLFANWVQHRRQSIHTVVPVLKGGYRIFVEVGDFLNAGLCINCYFDANLLSGVALDHWHSEISPYSQELERVKQYAAQAYLGMKGQVAQNLMATTNQPDLLIGDYDEMLMIPKHLQAGDLTALAYAYIYKLMLAYLFGNYTAALAYITQGSKYLQAVSGMIPVPVFHFYAALTHLALFATQSASEQVETLAQVDIHQGTIDLWAQTAPMNYRHKWQLIEAEKQRVLGNKAAAIEHYDQAIAGAKEHQFVHEAALANELAAKFYLDWNKEKIAQVYAIEAYYGYGRWGATAKVADLVALYPQLLTSILQPKSVDVFGTEITTIGNSVIFDTQLLDFNTLLKASRTISQEVNLDRTIANLLEIVIANAGADKCVLILKQAEDLQVVAQINLGQPANLLEPIAYDRSQDVAISLVNRVRNSLEPILLVDINQSVEFAADPYLQQYQPKSVLCSPILNKGDLIGILYLENQLMTGAFTRDRIETLQVLVAQAAISIENARLYTDLQTSFELLEQRVEERTIELKAAKEVAESAERTKTSFFNNMSHELRTPLNAILGMSEGLEEQVYGDLNPKQIRCVQVINSSGTHLLSLIDDVLDLAKLEAGRFELYCTPTDIAQLCHASIVFVEQQALKKQIQVAVQIPPNLPQLMVDERRICQVLINLLTNAVKFTPAGGQVDLAVAHIITDTHALIQFTVSDTGIGIEAANLDLLFQPFVQIDSALSRTAQGTGLGLNLVRELVALHGGRVSVTSNIGVGSRFSIDLPCGDNPFILPLNPNPAVHQPTL